MEKWGISLKTQIPALPPIEIENLGKGTGKVYFSSNIPGDADEK